MATATINGFIYTSKDGSFDFFRTDSMGKHGFALVMPHTITVEVPDDFDPSAAIRAALERKRAAALDEAARAEREIAQLGAIGKTEG